MKRSRYSATMSRCFGSSNQSRERKRRLGRPRELAMALGLASDAMSDHSLRKTRDIDASAEQSAGEWLLEQLIGVEAHAGAGDVKGLQIRSAECRLGDVG